MAKKSAPSPLPKFEGYPVVSATLVITKAGDGLSEALQIDPQAWRKHTLVTQEVAVVDEADVQALLEAQADRLTLAREAKALAEERELGIERIPGIQNDPEE